MIKRPNGSLKNCARHGNEPFGKRFENSIVIFNKKTVATKSFVVILTLFVPSTVANTRQKKRSIQNVTTYLLRFGHIKQHWYWQWNTIWSRKKWKCDKLWRFQIKARFLAFYELRRSKKETFIDTLNYEN